jgi:hypothetical protein
MSAPNPPRVDRRKEVPYDEIANLAKLLKNWDSYDAEPISLTAIDAAIEFMSRIVVGPRTDGGVAFEVRCEGMEFSVEFGPDGKMSSALVGWDRQ